VTKVITQEEAEALAQQHTQAVFDGDIEAATVLFTKDAIILMKDLPVAKGRKQIAAMMADWAAHAKRSKGEKKQTLGFHSDGNLAWWAASYSEELENDDGSTEIASGKFIDVLQRQSDGSWLFQAVCVYED